MESLLDQQLADELDEALLDQQLTETKLPEELEEWFAEFVGCIEAGFEFDPETYFDDVLQPSISP